MLHERLLKTRSAVAARGNHPRMKRFALILSLAVAAAGTAFAPAGAQVYVRVGPPPPVVERRPPPPGPGYAWRGGYWRWNGARYVWTNGYWAHAPYGRAAWIPGHWVQAPNGHWYFRDGHWS
jgi:hypothetical protein